MDSYLSSGLPARKASLGKLVRFTVQPFPKLFRLLVRRELHITAQEYLQEEADQCRQGLAARDPDERERNLGRIGNVISEPFLQDVPKTRGNVTSRIQKERESLKYLGGVFP